MIKTIKTAEKLPLLFLSLGLGFEDKGGEIAEYEGGGSTARRGGQRARKDAKQPLFVHRLPYSL